MTGLFLLEWLTAEGIVIYKYVRCGQAPVPGALLATTGIFVTLAIVSQAGPEAEKFSALLATGIIIAALMNVWTRTSCGESNTAVQQAESAPAPSGGTLA